MDEANGRNEEDETARPRKVGWQFVMTAAAYNLWRMPKLNVGANASAIDDDVAEGAGAARSGIRKASDYPRSTAIHAHYFRRGRRYGPARNPGERFSTSS